MTIAQHTFTPAVAAHLPMWANQTTAARASRSLKSAPKASPEDRLATRIQPLPPDSTGDEIATLYGMSFEVSPISAHLVPLALANLSEDSVLLLDNACLPLWDGGTLPSEAFLAAYAQWAYPLVDGHDRIHALIPDLIGGAESDNLSLIVEAYATCRLATQKLLPIWHPHESDEHLEEVLSLGFQHVAIGASPLYRQHGTPQWNARIRRALAIVQDARAATSRDIKAHVMTPRPDVAPLLPAGHPVADLVIPSSFKHLIWGHRHAGDGPIGTDD